MANGRRKEVETGGGEEWENENIRKTIQSTEHNCWTITFGKKFGQRKRKQYRYKWNPVLQAVQQSEQGKDNTRADTV